MNITYHLVGTLWHLLSLLPLRILYILSDIIYYPLFYCVRYRRKVVHKNLVNSFPEKTGKEILEIEKGFYSWFCDYVVETIKVRTMSSEEMHRRMTFDGLDAIYEEMERGGHTLCFAYLGHYCNWEWVASLPLWTREKLHCAQIYHPLESKVFDKLFLEQRSRYGAENISMNQTLRRIVTMQRKGEKSIIGFISDQTPHWNNIHLWMDFLHQDTPVFTGTERLAQQTNGCLYYIDITRPKRGYYRATFRPMQVDKDATSEYPITETYMHMLEQSIKEAPAYWLWSHNRWKRKHEVYERKMEERERGKQERIRQNQQQK
ncbi:MAG: lysophospholipid acyltransferase family protein [Bacteroidaceae bacterium]|nr:lysophospholipid acyltransferase family protein [Bacteroidaceae bacterium]